MKPYRSDSVVRNVNAASWVSPTTMKGPSKCDTIESSPPADNRQCSLEIRLMPSNMMLVSI